MYFVHKVATQGQFRTALAYTFRMTDATWTYQRHKISLDSRTWQ
jgi:hypothetical protein